MVGPWGFGLVAMLAVTGLLLVVAGARGALPRVRFRFGHGEGPDHLPIRLVLAVSGFVAASTITRWPVAALYCGLAGFFLPTLAAAKKRRKEAVERVEAIASWVESLRDTMAASAGIQEALRLSARVAPAPIRTEVRDMSLRLQHQSATQALRRFAVDMKHPLSDMVVAALILSTARHAGSLQGVLELTAKGARDSAAMMRQVEAGRTRTYTQARMAGWISFGIILFLTLARRKFLEPFDSFGGQIALFVILSAFFASGVALYRLSRPIEPRRLFLGIESWSELASTDLTRGRIR